MVAGETYEFMVVADDVSVDFSIDGMSVIFDDTPDGRVDTVEATYTATQTGFRPFSFVASALPADDGLYGLYTKTPGAENGLYWAVLGHTEGRAADLNASQLSAQSIADLGGGVTLIGEKRGEDLTGSDGDDLVFGGEGIDLIDGSDCNDVLIGGRGSDTYFLGPSSGFDLVTEELHEHWEFTTVQYEGYLQPADEFDVLAADVLIGFQMESGDRVIASINVDDATTGSISADGTGKIEAAMVLPAGAEDPNDPIFITDAVGTSLSFDDLVSRTTDILEGGAWPGGYGKSFSNNGSAEDYLRNAIEVFETEWEPVANTPLFTRAYEGTAASDINGAEALESFLQQEGIVLASQAVFSLEEAAKTNWFEADVANDVYTDEDADVALRTDAEVRVDVLDGAPVSFSAENGFTFAGFAQVIFDGEDRALLAATELTNGIDYELYAQADGELQLILSMSNGNEFSFTTTEDAGFFSGETKHFAVRNTEGGLGVDLSILVDGVPQATQYDVLALGSGPIEGSSTIEALNFGSENTNVTLTDLFLFEEGLSDAQIANLALEGASVVNNAPLLQNDLFETLEGEVLSSNLFEDNGLGADTDPEGALLEIVSINGNVDLVGQSIALASGALLTVNLDGSFEYDPNGAFEALAQGGPASVDHFTYTASDGVDKTATAEALISVLGENDAPQILNPLGIGVTEGEIEAYDVGYFLERVSDIDDESTVFLDFVDPRFARYDNASTVYLDATGSGFDWLSQGVTLTEFFEFGVRDEFGAVETALVPLNITGTNDRPVAGDVDGLTTLSDASLNIDVTTLLAEVNDPDTGAVLSFVGFDDTGLDGTLTWQNGQDVVFSPGTSFNSLKIGQSGSTSFTYVVQDEYGAQASGTVNVAVIGTSTTALAVDDQVETERDVEIFIDVSANDEIGSSSDLLSAELTATPDAGFVAFGSDGTVTYDPLPRWFGLDTFSYEITNTDGQTSQATVTVDVLGPAGFETANLQRDINGGTGWDARFDIVDQDGDRTGEVVVFDDGSITETVYVDGVRSEVISQDLQNTKTWDSIDSAFDADGIITRKTTYIDDGRTTEFSYVNGVLELRSQKDPSNVTAWDSIVTRFDDMGVITSKTVTFDDGRISETPFVDGIPQTTLQTDLEDAKPWESVVKNYDANGEIADQTTLSDDGVETIATYVDGVRSEARKYDHSDVKLWDNILEFYDSSGVIVDRITVFDDGRYSETAFTDGVRDTSTFIDTENAYPWERRDFFYDTEGELVDLLVTPDQDELF